MSEVVTVSVLSPALLTAAVLRAARPRSELTPTAESFTAAEQTAGRYNC